MKHAFVFTLLLWLTSGCSTTTTNPVNQALKSAFDLKPGSYWIYLDSVTGRTDSFFVRYNLHSQEHYIVKHEHVDDDNIEVLLSDYNDLGITADTTLWMWYMVLNRLELSQRNNAIKTWDDRYLAFKQFLSYPFGTTDTFYDVTQKSKVCRVLDNYNVNGLTFGKVYEVSCFKSDSSINKVWMRNYYYVSPEAGGFVRLVIDQPLDSIYHVLNLVRYHLQY